MIQPTVVNFDSIGQYAELIDSIPPGPKTLAPVNLLKRGASRQPALPLTPANHGER